ncbi:MULTISPECIES: DUF6124 family protein [unclassified Pseudomonas]|uniref:DUF6124 family protein n=1 Tax=unclassified Pseudomonas TaxID=196821 RepID=UPI0015A1E3FC|nr:hypothetical protein [Pseudomonas sp. D4002]NWB24514.1 hypothetical protein [Pseudomonas sp. D4002]
MFKIVPDSPRDQAKDRAAFNRALDHYLPTDPPQPSTNFYAISDEISFEDSLLFTADLLHSASATALDCGEQLQSPERAKVLAVWHLLEMAKAMVDRSIECLHPRKT